jgi:hypothetical protein
MAKKKLDPQFSRLGALVSAICANDLALLEFLLEKMKTRNRIRKINHPLPFSVTRHRIFSRLAEVDATDQRLFEIQNVLGCAAYLNREGCLRLLQEFGAKLVRQSFLSLPRSACC